MIQQDDKSVLKRIVRRAREFFYPSPSYYKQLIEDKLIRALTLVLDRANPDDRPSGWFFSRRHPNREIAEYSVRKIMGLVYPVMEGYVQTKIKAAKTGVMYLCNWSVNIFKRGMSCLFNKLQVGDIPDNLLIPHQGDISPGLQYQSVAGDGSCLYRAVSYYLGRGEDVSFLRSMVAANLEHNKAQYAGFIPLRDGQSIQDYIAEIRNTPAWATEVEINILMRLLDRPIVIIGPDGMIRNKEAVNQYSGKEPIFVFYNGGDEQDSGKPGHYNALLLRDGYDGRSILSDEPILFLTDTTPGVESPSGVIDEPQQQVCVEAVENIFAANLPQLLSAIAREHSGTETEKAIVTESDKTELDKIVKRTRNNPLIEIIQEQDRFRDSGLAELRTVAESGETYVAAAAPSAETVAETGETYAVAAAPSAETVAETGETYVAAAAPSAETVAETGETYVAAAAPSAETVAESGETYVAAAAPSAELRTVAELGRTYMAAAPVPSSEGGGYFSTSTHLFGGRSSAVPVVQQHVNLNGERQGQPNDLLSYQPARYRHVIPQV